MAPPSSSSFVRKHANRKRTQSFQTCIHPDQAEIQICPGFKNAWIKQLQKNSHGWLRHPAGNSARVTLFLKGNNCYMVDGRFASVCFGFRRPTRVILTYEVVDNRFKVTVIKNETVEDAAGNVKHREDKDVIVVENSEGSSKSIISAKSEPDSDDMIYGEITSAFYVSGCALPGFTNDRVFSWELPITKAYASSKKDQVLYIPQGSFKRMLRNKSSITIRTNHNGDGLKWNLITYERKKGKEEMYVSKGWFEFLKANNLKKGDQLRFQICDPPNVLVVDIVRRRTT